MKKPTPKKRIRCKPYDDEWHPTIAAGLARIGKTNAEIADYFGVNKDTIYTWQKKHHKFKESLKRNKDFIDFFVEDSLLKRACGYKHPEDKIFNNNGEEMIVKTTKHYPPDTTAAIFWLKNRQPDKWREKKIVENHNRDIIVDSEKDKEALEDV